jgi:N-acetylglucosaminyldiphosphoundecaprenol N-acetyl-beta-D-mannosaminyltransferase
MLDDKRVDVLGVNVSVGTLESAYRKIREWIDGGQKHFVTVTGAHGVIESSRDAELREIHNRAGMVTADGMPLVWMSWLQGMRQAERVYGPDLMRHALERSSADGPRHFLYGSTPRTLTALVHAIGRDYPAAIIAGAYSPPFRATGEREDAEVIDAINAARPDIVWVGLSTPKQEYWMDRHRDSLDASALIGVGAAFDFLAGVKSQAPRIIQRSGLEWFYRMVSEPRRLLKRYADIVPRFLVLCALQLAGLHTPQNR